MSSVFDCEMTVEGSGPPLFLVHGIGAARDAWRFMMPALRQHFTVVSYDLRGHGTSPLPEREFGLDELVADLERVRERSGFTKAFFAGHSLGGQICPAYAVKYPHHVLKLGLLSTAAFRTENDSAKVWGVVHAMEEKGIPQVLETLTARWFTDEFISANPQIVERRLKQVIATDPGVFMNVFRIYAGTEMGPLLPRINVPALIVTGENDGGCNPRLNGLIHAAIPDSRLVVLPHYRHSILVEAADEVCTHLLDFMLE